MITIRTFFASVRMLLTDARALAVFAALYALLLVTLYFYIATREATVWQVMITLGGLIVIPAEFFVLQSAIVHKARHESFSWRPLLRDAVSFFIVTLPILIVGALLWFLLNKWQAHYPPPVITTLAETSANQTRPNHWPTLLFATARCLVFGVALPLLTIQLWIEVASHDLKTFFSTLLKRIRSAFARAFSSDSVLTYALGLVLFVAVPYALLFVPVTIKGNKTEFTIFIFRLLLVFVFTLIGWIVTVSALVKLSGETSAAVAPKAEAKPLELSEEPAG